MKKIKQIVVPVDFAFHTDKLVEYAAYLAEELSAVIHFIHVVEFYPGNSMTALPYVLQHEQDILREVRRKMSDLLENNSEKCRECTGEVVIGDPVDKIIEFARTLESDMIIMNTHGSKGLEKIMLGSVAERVLKRAHCPVLIMNPYRK